MAYYDPDYELAVKLQAKFDKANSVTKKNKIKENVPWKTSSVVDPIWETTDPTPDIHALFLAFNKRFFWGSLNSVEVRWSPRMTSCAGVCVYENRNGFCSVRLSAPLLKLRPRSDLVETLLHEMIHAYLFVTKNDRDRDGHGPIFQSHMHRINKEAGTKITIYHSFHEEVKLYQQHWWRCDGPCQSRKPYFGFVKRSMNRAPGPSDFWWTEHQATCGGKYIKVKEPEGFIKNKTQKKDKKLPNSQIAGYFKSTDTPIATNKKNHLINQISSTDKNLKDSTNKANICSTVNKNIFGFVDLTGSTRTSPFTGAEKKPKVSKPTNHSPYSKSNEVSNSKSSKTANNVVGYKDFMNNRNTKSTGAIKKTGPANINGFTSGGMLANRGSGTLVVTSKQNQPKNLENKSQNTDIVPFSGSGFVLGSKPKNIERKEFQNNVVLSLENGCVSKNNLDRKNSSFAKGNKLKLDNLSEIGDKCSKRRINDQGEMSPYLQSSMLNDAFPVQSNCPICNVNISVFEMDSHLDSCVKPSDETCQCPICNVHVSRHSMNTHFEDCAGLSNVFNDSSTLELSDDEDVESEANKVQCPCCSRSVEVSGINQHLDECLNQELLKASN